MNTPNAVRCALILSGKYNHPTDKLVMSGYDLHGNPIAETVPSIDGEALERDVQAVLSGRPTMSGRLITSISVEKDKQ